MKKWLINHYGFSKRNLNGLFVLLLLILVATLAPSIYRLYFLKPASIDPNEALALQQLEMVDRYAKRYDKNTRNEIEDTSDQLPVYYETFDPNLVDEKKWQQFGLSYKQAMAIVNYVKKGGRFYKPEDLKKMYTISPEKYEALLPYVVLSESKPFEKKTMPIYTKKELVMVEINTADTLELDKIRGVGIAFAKRIIRYRERLGGFYSKEQLFEVFGIDTPKFDEIKDQIKIDVGAIRKLNINTVEFEDFKRYPYLSFKQMNAIIQYRKQHGPYKSIADLNKVLILRPETIEKMAPYLSF
ncbi:helix-hairpin-helix domain-containing protein [Pedobacter sp.]|uniref:ComEA family DNA-binding protein n=1 Tax=Pedobacter sp. TaxID=1411316 RepID=UPI0031D2F84F